MTASSKAGADGNSPRKSPAWLGSLPPGAKSGKQRREQDWIGGDLYTPDPDAAYQFRKWAALGLLILALAAFAVFYMRGLENTPLVILRADAYPLQMPPLAFAWEDAELLKKVNANIRALEPVILGARDYRDAFRKRLEAAAASRSLAWMGHDTVVLWVAAHGAVNEKREPCLVLPQSDPLNSATWLRLAELFEDLKREPKLAKKKKVVLLDCQRYTSCWRAGWMENRFVDELPQVLAEAADPNLYVITSAGPGEVAWAAPEKKGTVFGYFLAHALRGQGFSFGGSIPLGKLFIQVSQDVNRYCQQRHGLNQRPQLLHQSGVLSVSQEGKLVGTDAGRAPVKSVGIAYVPYGRRGSIDELQSAEDPVAKASALFFGPTPASVSQPPGLRFDGSLSSAWRLFQQRRSPPAGSGLLPGYVANPVAWAEVQHRLAAIGERLLAGEEYQKGLPAEIARVGRDLMSSEKWAPVGALPDDLNLPLATRSEPARIDKENAFRDYLNRLKNAKDEPPLPIPPQVTDAQLVHDIYEVLEDAPPTELRGWLHEAVQVLAKRRRPGGSAGLIEAHFLTLLDAEPATGEGAPPELFKRALAVRSSAERVASPLDFRIHYALEPLVNAADDKRRQAEDALFLAASPDEVLRRLSEAEGAPASGSGYRAAEATVSTLAKAFQLRDKVWSHLPLLAEWHLTHAAWGQPTRALEAVGQLLEAEGSSPRTVGVFALSQHLEAALQSRDNPAARTKALEDVQRAYEEVELQWEEVLADPQQVYSVSVKEGIWTREGFRDAELALRYPPLVDASLEPLVQRLLKELQESRPERATEHRLAPTATVKPRQVLKEFDRAMEFEFDREYKEHRSKDERWAEANTVDQAFAAHRGRIKGLLDAYNNLADPQPWTAERTAMSTLAELRRWDHRVRVGIPWFPLSLFSAEKEDKHPARRLQKYDARHLTAWHAYRVLEDFWGTGRLPDDSLEPDAGPFFVDAVRRCRTAFDRGDHPWPNLRYDVPGGGLVDFSLADAPAVEALRSWNGVRFRGVQLPAAGSPDPIRCSLEPEAALAADGKPLPVPGGEATLRLVGPDVAAISRASFTGGRTAEPIPQPVQPAASPIQATVPVGASGPASMRLLARFWYRGHVREVPSPTTPTTRAIEYTHKYQDRSAPTVRVNGADAIRGTVLFVFDCSTSMRSADGRFIAARDQLAEVLSDARFTGRGLRVGLMLYGHRTDVNAMNPVHDRRRIWNDPALPPRPASPHPDADCELLIAPQPGNADEVQRRVRTLRVEQCVGVTPLYHSIRKAIELLSSEPGPHQVVVISDGVNMPWNVEALTDPTTRQLTDYRFGTVLINGSPTSGAIVDTQEYEGLQRALQANVGKTSVTVHLFGGFKTAFEEAQLLRLRSLANSHENFSWKQLQFASLIANSILDSFPRTQLSLGSDGNRSQVQPLAFGQTAEVKDWRAAGNLQRYTVEVKPAGSSPVVKPIDLLGGESVVLNYDALNREPELTFVGDNFRPLATTTVRTDASLLVDAGEPDFRANTIVRHFFRIRHRNDREQFTPRPPYIWLEVRPEPSAEAASLVFPRLDAIWKENTNLPLLEVPVDDWPLESRSARVQFWFRNDPPGPPAESLAPSEQGTKKVTRDLDAWEIRQSGGSAGMDRQISVSCRPGGNSASLDTLLRRAVWVSPPPDRVHRRYLRNGSEATHTFTYERTETSTVQVWLVTRDDFQRGASYAEFRFSAGN